MKQAALDEICRQIYEKTKDLPEEDLASVICAVDGIRSAALRWFIGGGPMECFWEYKEAYRILKSLDLLVDGLPLPYEGSSS